MTELEKLYRMTVGSCTICKGQGFRRQGASQVSCTCRNRLNELQRFADQGIPSIYWEKSLKDYTSPDANSYDAIIRYMTEIQQMYMKGMGLFVHGSYGIGKTGLIIEILKEIARRRDPSTREHLYTLAYHFWPEVMRKLTAFEEVSGEERALLQEQMSTVDFLLLDDVGREHRASGSTWVSSNIDAIFRNRMAKGLPTLITSNFTMARIGEFYGDSVFSVFTGMLIEVPMYGTDYRFRTNQQESEMLLNGGWN